MLYLEDYLEMIEHLPQELRDRFTEMREMDLAVQNNTDALDKRVRALFQQCRRAEISSPMADVEFDSIRTNYYRVLDDSDEKIQLAGQMYDLVERYLRRLDTELDKFKCELEADHNGITEILEKRSLELDSMTSNGGANQKENRFYDTQNSHSASHSSRTDGGSGSRYKVKAEKRRDSVAPGMSIAAAASVEKRSVAGSSKPLNNSALRPTTGAVMAAGGLGVAGGVASATVAGAGPMVVGSVVPGVPGAIGPIASATVASGGSGALGAVSCPQAVPVMSAAGQGTATVAATTYNLQTCGAGNAIVAAASQAIAQTQQMQQGRRTASLKASYEAIGGVGSHELLLNSELAGATHNALQAVERESTAFSNQRRQKKKSVNALGCGNLRTNPAMLVNASTVTSILPSPSPNVQTVSSSPSLSSVSVHVHPTPLQPQQHQQQPQQSFISPQQQQQQQQSLGHQTPVQSQQLLIHANTPVTLQHGQLQPQVMQQLSLPQHPSMKQHLPPGQQQQQLINQQKPVQLVSTQHRMPRQLQPQQIQQSLQAQHLQQQQQLQRPQLLQQQTQQLHTVPHQQLLQAQTQQKQLQQLKSAPEGEWFDPNEPRYCLCNQVSYGDMVACDNEDCPFEWFHYPCVNISSSPKGKWYCPQCSSSMKRRASRKN
uniref:Inhibitor of growth protein n=1 Tax=Anopheles christyi TaxID=43041 RepID=A0A182K2H3_9DIPT